jgi:UDP:flavonoid glycosyltransferase YjiC (YdhE family)
MLYSWSEPVRQLRKELGLPANVEPILTDKFSNLLNLALFSKVLAAPKPDWHPPTVQTGFPFYDGKMDLGKMPEKLRDFLEAGEPPIVFTLGSAAVWAAGSFFRESSMAAKKLKHRAVLILGENEEPPDLPPEIICVDYAPYSEVFPRAAVVVHQAGIGTTGQVLRAGVPHLIMPFSHDQPDNAARCVRIGVARKIKRENYNALRAETNLRELISNLNYKMNAQTVKRVIDTENGVKSACNEIERVLKNGK